jgi:ribonuclease P protein component
MIASVYRLRGNSFKEVLDKGKMFQSDSFGIAFVKREDEEVPRFGFIVSTKVSKEAVQRNRIKRALSEAVRFMTSDIKSGYDVVFLAKQRAARSSTDVLMNEVREAIKTAELFK